MLDFSGKVNAYRSFGRIIWMMHNPFWVGLFGGQGGSTLELPASIAASTVASGFRHPRASLRSPSPEWRKLVPQTKNKRRTNETNETSIISMPRFNLHHLKSTPTRIYFLLIQPWSREIQSLKRVISSGSWAIVIFNRATILTWRWWLIQQILKGVSYGKYDWHPRIPGVRL